LTSGRVVASMTSCSPMMPLRWRGSARFLKPIRSSLAFAAQWPRSLRRYRDGPGRQTRPDAAPTRRLPHEKRRGNGALCRQDQYLRSRVRSYFRRSEDGRYRIQALIPNLEDIKFPVTDTEREALIEAVAAQL
jgi:hypothetical protein